MQFWICLLLGLWFTDMLLNQYHTFLAQSMIMEHIHGLGVCMLVPNFTSQVWYKISYYHEKIQLGHLSVSLAICWSPSPQNITVNYCLYTVSTCINAQSISSLIKMKVGVCIFPRHNLHWVTSNFKMQFEPNGDVRCPELCVYAHGYSSLHMYTLQAVYKDRS